MGVRRPLAAAALSAALALAACTSPPAPEPTADVQSVIVEGSLGSIPAVSVPDGLEVEGREELTAIAGYGRELAAGDTAILTVTTFDETGTLLDEEATGEPKIVTVDDDGVGSVLADTLPGEHEGSRVVLLERVQKDRSATTLITVVDILPTSAQGTEAAPIEGVPEVELVDDRQQAKAAGEEPAPAELVVAPLIVGKGAQVLDDQRVLMTYAITHYATGELIDATEPNTPVQVDMADVIAGLRAGVLDQRVGSRVLLVVPPDQASGTDTVAIVVDILAAYTPDADEHGAAG